MGGCGSGRQGFGTGKTTTSDVTELDIRYLKREGLLASGRVSSICWTRNGRENGSIGLAADDGWIVLNYTSTDYDGQKTDYHTRVYIEEMLTQFGGVRHWFQCPNIRCRRRVAILYNRGKFVCRKCAKLGYDSQLEDAFHRRYRTINKLRDRLDWPRGLMTGGWQKPKYMHWRTFNNLVDELNHIERRQMIRLDQYIQNMHVQLKAVGG